MPLERTESAQGAIEIIVIGAGLAGAACAQALAKRGCSVTVLNAGGGASQLPVGLLAAHLSAQDIALSQLSRIGVVTTLAHARALLREGIDWQPGDLLQKLFFHPEKNARLREGAALLAPWYEVSEPLIRHKKAAWIKPQALALAWLSQPGISVQTASVQRLQQDGADWQAIDVQGHTIARASHIIIASGAHSSKLLAQCHHPLTMDNVGGSVAIGPWSGLATLPDPIINGHGHFIGGVADAAGGSFWLSGATYEREVYATPQEQHDASMRANLERLVKLLPAELLASIKAQFASGQVHSWQGTRCTTSDRMPIVGQLERGLYVCTAMGSRGLSFAALSAEILAQEIVPDGSPPLLTDCLRRQLLPSRPTLKGSTP